MRACRPQALRRDASRRVHESHTTQKTQTDKTHAARKTAPRHPRKKYIGDAATYWCTRRKTTTVARRSRASSLPPLKIRAISVVSYTRPRVVALREVTKNKERESSSKPGRHRPQVLPKSRLGGPNTAYQLHLQQQQPQKQVIRSGSTTLPLPAPSSQFPVCVRALRELFRPPSPTTRVSSSQPLQDGRRLAFAPSAAPRRQGCKFKLQQRGRPAGDASDLLLRCKQCGTLPVSACSVIIIFFGTILLLLPRYSLRQFRHFGRCVCVFLCVPPEKVFHTSEVPGRSYCSASVRSTACPYVAVSLLQRRRPLVLRRHSSESSRPECTKRTVDEMMAGHRSVIILCTTTPETVAAPLHLRACQPAFLHPRVRRRSTVPRCQRGPPSPTTKPAGLYVNS